MKKKVLDIIPKPKKEPKIFLEKAKKIKFPLLSKNKIIFLNLFFFLILIAIFSFLFSSAKIKIWPQITTQTLQTEVSLDKNFESLNFEKKILPARIFETEESFSQEFPATGKVKKEEKARGIVRIFNNFDRDQILVANTRLRPPTEKFKIPLEENENPWFRTTERVIVPAKGYVDVKVIADSPGEKYNIEPSTFSIPGLIGTPQYTLVYGKSSEPMKGGKIGEVPQIIREDLENAEKTLTKKIENEIIKILEKKVPKEFEILPETLNLEFLEKKSLAQPGEEKEKFVFQIKAKAKIIGFKKEDIKNFALEYILGEISSDKEVLKESLKINWKTKNFDFEAGKVNILLDFSIETYPKLNLGDLKRALAGLSAEEAKVFLERQEGIKEATIQIFPFWVREITKDLKRIEISYPMID